MAAEINQKENDMQLLIDGYQVQVIFSKNSGRDGKQTGNIIEELQNILLTTYLKWKWNKSLHEKIWRGFDFVRYYKKIFDNKTHLLYPMIFWI